MTAVVPETPTVQAIPVVDLYPHPANRKQFDPKRLEELTGNIRQVGILTPLLVRPALERMPNQFEIIAGERRWRAAQAAGLETVPCVVRDLDDDAAIEVLLTENLQREDPNPLEEADAYAAWLERHPAQVRELAAKVGKSVAHVYSRLQLRTLDEDAKTLVWAGQLPVTHAQVLARASAPQQKKAITEIKRRLEYSDHAGSLVNLTEDLLDYDRQLENAVFPIEDATLCPVAGSCLTCPKRSGYTDGMFPELQTALVQIERNNTMEEDGKLPPDTCLDATCWAEKERAFLERRRIEAREDYGEALVELTTREGNEWPAKESQPIPMGVWEQATKKTEGAVPGLLVQLSPSFTGPGYDLGAVLWVTLKPKGKNGAKAKGPKELPWERDRRLREARANVERPRRIALARAIMAAPRPKLDRAALFAEVVGRIDDWRVKSAAQEIGMTMPKLGPTMSDGDLVGALMLERFNAELGSHRCGSGHAPEGLLKAAKAVGVDAKKVLAAFDAEVAAKAKAAPKGAPIAGTCQVCGCTETSPCDTDDDDETCAWANKEQTLCTACPAPKVQAAKPAKKRAGDVAAAKKKAKAKKGGR